MALNTILIGGIVALAVVIVLFLVFIVVKRAISGASTTQIPQAYQVMQRQKEMADKDKFTPSHLKSEQA